MRAISLGVLLGAGLAVFAVSACTSGGDSSDDGGTGGTATGGTGNATGGAGNATGGAGTDTGGTGTATGGGGSGDPDAVACGAASEALILDFAPGMGGAASTTDSTFGDFTNTFSGGTFIYGAGLTSDVSGENWHISGDLADYGGFGLFFQDCTKVDLSAFKGIKFDISGDTDGKAITLNVGTAANDITSAWLEANKAATDPAVVPNFGQCTPAANKYDGTCAAPSKSIAIPAGGGTVSVTWAELLGGKPDGTVNPAEITSIAWNFTAPAGAGTETVTAYPIDVTIDNIGFIE